MLDDITGRFGYMSTNPKKLVDQNTCSHKSLHRERGISIKEDKNGKQYVEDTEFMVCDRCGATFKILEDDE